MLGVRVNSVRLWLAAFNSVHHSIEHVDAGHIIQHVGTSIWVPASPGVLTHARGTMTMYIV
jgi:hypothetical protein